jgi:Flp pilus assembly protein protease CpaA
MSAASPVASHIVLVITAALLLYIAAIDLREFKIRNEVIAVLAVLFFVHPRCPDAGLPCTGMSASPWRCSC